MSLGHPQWRLAQNTDRPQPTVSVSKVILVEPGSTTPLPIIVGPPAAVPEKAFIRLRGLPTDATLSHGHLISPGSWAIPLFALRELKLTVPAGASGRARMSIALATLEGGVVADAEAALIVGPAALVAPKSSAPPPPQASPSTAAATPTSPAPPVPPTTGATNRIAPAAPAPRPPTTARREPAKQAAPAPPPARTEMSAADQQRAERLFKRGNELLDQGDIASARLFLRRAADVGLAKAALLLGGTFDPAMIATFSAVGLAPDREEAMKWYEEARRLGSDEARRRLSRLQSGR